MLRVIAPNQRIIRVSHTDIHHMFGMMATAIQHSGLYWRQLSINNETHDLLSDKNGVIGFSCSVFQAGVDILILKMWEIFEDFRSRNVRGE